MGPCLLHSRDAIGAVTSLRHMGLPDFESRPQRQRGDRTAPGALSVPRMPRAGPDGRGRPPPPRGLRLMVDDGLNRAEQGLTTYRELFHVGVLRPTDDLAEEQ